MARVEGAVASDFAISMLVEEVNFSGIDRKVDMLYLSSDVSAGAEGEINN